MKWMLKESQVIGGMRTLSLSAPFSRAQIVLASDSHPNARLIVHRYLSADEAEGDHITEEEWADLIAAEESTTLQHGHVVAKPHLAFWVLRPSFPEREAAMDKLAKRAGAVTHREQQGDAIVVIADESRAHAILDEWARDAFDRAWHLAETGNWKEAAVFAHLSWLLDIGSGVDRAALYALTVENTEGPSASEDIVALEENSRRKEDTKALRDLIGRYREQFSPDPGIHSGAGTNTLILFPRLKQRSSIIHP